MKSINTNTEGSSKIELLRWLLMPFVAFGVPLSFSWLIGTSAEAMGLTGAAVAVGMAIFLSFAQGFLFILCGCEVAPNNKRTVAVVLISLMFFSWVVSLFFISRLSIILSIFDARWLIDAIFYCAAFYIAGMLYGYRRARIRHQVAESE